jgi:hypothetical protein
LCSSCFYDYLQVDFRCSVRVHIRVHGDGPVQHVLKSGKWVKLYMRTSELGRGRVVNIKCWKKPTGSSTNFSSVLLFCIYFYYPCGLAANVSKILYSFSLKRNFQQLLSINESPEDIKAVHGIRALNAFMLLASHKSMAMFFNPYSNRTSMTEVRANDDVNV